MIFFKGKCLPSSFFIFCTFAFLQQVQAQQAIALKKYNVANSGCQVSLPNSPQDVVAALDVDSNKIYSLLSVSKVGKQECHYAVHILQLREGAPDEDVFDRLTQYLDYIKSTQNVVSSSGYKKGNNLLKGKLSNSLAENWVDHGGQEFAVMGWAKGRTMAVLYVYSQDAIPAQANAQLFLNSLQFPSAF